MIHGKTSHEEFITVFLPVRSPSLKTIFLSILAYLYFSFLLSLFPFHPFSTIMNGGSGRNLRTECTNIAVTNNIKHVAFRIST
jgi:hypothetical protein